MAVENITRFTKSKGYKVNVKENGNEYTLDIRNRWKMKDCVYYFQITQHFLIFEKIWKLSYTVKLMPVPRQVSSSCGTAAKISTTRRNIKYMWWKRNSVEVPQNRTQENLGLNYYNCITKLNYYCIFPIYNVFIYQILRGREMNRIRIYQIKNLKLILTRPMIRFKIFRLLNHRRVCLWFLWPISHLGVSVEPIYAGPYRPLNCPAEQSKVTIGWHFETGYSPRHKGHTQEPLSRTTAYTNLIWCQVRTYWLIPKSMHLPAVLGDQELSLSLNKP